MSVAGIVLSNLWSMIMDTSCNRCPLSSAIVLALALVSSLGVLKEKGRQAAAAMDASSGPAEPARQDDAGGRAAFAAAYKVFMHPRCMNCHPRGDAPLQGDDSRAHAQNIKRGSDGKGLYALKCANCHQSTNLPGAHLPPGNPNWHLPPAKTRMVFEGKTPAELARQLKDRERNGGKTLDQILRHVTEDKLVLWGWDPGEGRTTPPLSHAEFAGKMREWIEKGALIPE